MKPSQNGTLREHLEQVEKQTGKKPKALIPPEFPSLLAHIWSAFLDLNSSRTMGPASPNAITYDTILAYCNLMLCPLTPRDVELVKKLDRKYLEVMNKDE